MNPLPAYTVCSNFRRHQSEPNDSAWIALARARHLLRLLLAMLPALLISACTIAMPGPITQPDSLVEYWRSGGFAGLDDHLVVSDAGHVTTTRHDKTVEYNLSPQELEETVQLLESVDFASLNKTYSAGQGADLIEYKISFSGQLVQAEDSVVPAELEPLFEYLDGLLSRTS